MKIDVGMKKDILINRMMTAVVALSLCIGLSACSDDDDDNDVNTEEGVEQMAQQEDWNTPSGQEETGEGSETSMKLTDNEQLLLRQGSAVCSILNALTGINGSTSETQHSFTRFDQQTYEPTIGVVLDDSRPAVRSVKSTSVEDAEAQFLAMVAADELLTTTADGYSLSLVNMPLLTDGTRLTLGTLTFHRGDNQRRTGYVDVDIRCLPGLQRIEYIVPEAFPMNAATNSPYKMGDLVWVDNDKYSKGYYLCVEQASNYPGILVKLCEGEQKDDKTYNLDGDSEGVWGAYNNTKGESTSENDVRAYLMFLLSEKDKVANLKLFLDGKSTTKPLHEGKKSDIFPSGFATEQNYVFKSDDGKSGRIFYFMDYGDYAWIPAYHYRYVMYMWVSNNMSSMKYVEPYKYEYVYDSDWRNWEGKHHNFAMNVIHFYDNKVSGATIDYSPTNDNLTFQNDAEYATQENVGWVYADDHRLYATSSKAVAAGAQPLGIVAYVNDGSEFGDKVTEMDNGYGHGLVLSHRLAAGAWSKRWSTGATMVTPSDYGFYTQFVNKTTGTAGALSDFGGLDKTADLRSAGSPAATAAYQHTPQPPQPYASDWFLPSTAQWLAMLCAPGVGGQPLPSPSEAFPTYVENNTANAYSAIDNVIKGNSWSYYKMGQNSYWTSSAYNGKTGIYVTGKGATRLTYYNWSTYAYVRPVFAF